MQSARSVRSLAQMTNSAKICFTPRSFVIINIDVFFHFLSFARSGIVKIESWKLDFHKGKSKNVRDPLPLKLDPIKDNSIARKNTINLNINYKYKFKYKYKLYHMHGTFKSCVVSWKESRLYHNVSFFIFCLLAPKYEVKHRQWCNIFVNIRTTGRAGSLGITWELLCFVILIARHPGKNPRTFPTIL